jgi:hypothetical protein
MIEHLQHFMGNFLSRTKLLHIFCFNKIDVEFIDQVVFRLFKIANSYIVQYLPDKLFGPCMPTFLICSQYSSVSPFGSFTLHSRLSIPHAIESGMPCMFPEGRSIWCMNISMRINPNYTQSCARICFFNSGHRSISRSDLRPITMEKSSKICFIYFQAHALLHDQHAINKFGIRMFGTVKQKFVYVFNFYRIDTF